MSIQVIVFDMGNVLLEWNVDKVIRAVESDGARQIELKRAIFESGIWDKIDAGEYTIEVAEQQAFQLLDKSYHAAIHQIMWEWYRHIDVFYEVQNLAASLVDVGYRLYILSNTSSVFYRLAADGYLPLITYISGVTLSFEEKQMKPSETIYKTLLSKYQLLPEQCVFIDDISKNVETARALGMQGFVATGETSVVNYLKELIEIRKRRVYSNGNN